MAISDLFYIDSAGLQIPDYTQVLDFLRGEYRSIYGQDVYLEPDSQDGQWIAVQALAIYETMRVCQDVYNSFSPAYAQRDALSRNVLINGISRKIGTKAVVDLLITGQPGVTIRDGIAEDMLNQKWLLPATVTVPISGQITVTATSSISGRVSAAASTITRIATPTIGWISVTNPAASIGGTDTETDAQLRARQALAVATPTQSLIDGIYSTLSTISGVTKIRIYENSTSSTDANGIPPHSIAVVIEGGAVSEIGQTIALKKSIGCGTFGTTSVDVIDQQGVSTTIYFTRPVIATVGVTVNLTARPGYLSSTAAMIQAAVSAYIGTLMIGDDVYLSKVISPAVLANNPDVSNTFDISSVLLSKNGSTPAAQNIVINYNEIATTTIADVTVVVT